MSFQTARSRLKVLTVVQETQMLRINASLPAEFALTFATFVMALMLPVSCARQHMHDLRNSPSQQYLPQCLAIRRELIAALTPSNLSTALSQPRDVLTPCQIHNRRDPFGAR